MISAGETNLNEEYNETEITARGTLTFQERNNGDN